MTEKHLKFCISHDWGRGAVLIDGTISNLRSDIPGDDSTMSFDDIDDLLEWAGY